MQEALHHQPARATKLKKHNSLFSLKETVNLLEYRVKKLEALLVLGSSFGIGNPKVPVDEKRCKFNIVRHSRQCRRLRMLGHEYCPTHWLMLQKPETLTEQQQQALFRLQNPPSSHPHLWLQPQSEDLYIIETQADASAEG